jgi:hypothetical protein
MPRFNKTRGLEVESKELTCGICLGIFCDPIETKFCRKTYCSKYIKDWILENSSCPVDRTYLSIDALITLSKVTIRLLCKLKIRYDYECMGCEEVIGFAFESFNWLCFQ